jgi:predicted TIM-barrel fold metal-dependent hydrolase
MTDSHSESARVRQRLDHPVIDADGHMIETFPVLFDFVKQVGGPAMTERTWASFRRQNSRGWYDMSVVERRHHNQMRPAFWAAPAENTLDRATAMLPALMRERLPEMGIDYAVIYPTIGFLLPDIPDDEVRQVMCRAQNLMMAEMFRGCEDRLTPAAVIPCHTPAEAIAELEFAVRELGYKVPMFANLVRRPVGAVAERDASLAPYAFWVDPLALDSPYDYDPLWQKCLELRVPVTSHAIGQGIGLRRSISNYMYNQTGHFADAGHAFAKALFFGGVTRRFPDLNFAFLECGVAWGASLLCDLVERWEKRNAEAVQQFNPARVDYEQLAALFERHGGTLLAGRIDPAAVSRDAADQDVDDFAAADIDDFGDLLARFVPRFFYGCEADDRMIYTAFNRRALPGGRPLRAMFSSDIGHWDVTDMRRILADAWELVEDGLLTEDDFRDFVCTNPARLFTGANPEFFAGTAVAGALDSILGREIA